MNGETLMGYRFQGQIWVDDLNALWTQGGLQYAPPFR